MRIGTQEHLMTLGECVKIKRNSVHSVCEKALHANINSKFYIRKAVWICVWSFKAKAYS